MLLYVYVSGGIFHGVYVTDRDKDQLRCCHFKARKTICCDQGWF